MTELEVILSDLFDIPPGAEVEWDRHGDELTFEWTEEVFEDEHTEKLVGLVAKSIVDTNK